MCLPNISDLGFLQAFIHFLPPDKNLAIVIISNQTSNEVFHSFQ